MLMRASGPRFVTAIAISAMLSTGCRDGASERRAKEIDDMNRRHDEAERVRRARDSAADAARAAADEAAHAQAAALLSTLRSLSPAERLSRATRACADEAICPNDTTAQLMESAASDAERDQISTTLKPVIAKRNADQAAREARAHPFSGKSAAQLKTAARHECREGACSADVLGEIVESAAPADEDAVRCVVRFEEDSWACRTGENAALCNSPPCR